MKPSQAQLLAEIARAKAFALEQTEEVYDPYENVRYVKNKPDIAAATRLIELEARVRGFLKNDSDSSEDEQLDVSVEELREILEGIERNGKPATATESKRTDARANPRR